MNFNQRNSQYGDNNTQNITNNINQITVLAPNRQYQNSSKNQFERFLTYIDSFISKYFDWFVGLLSVLLVLFFQNYSVIIKFIRTIFTDNRLIFISAISSIILYLFAGIKTHSWLKSISIFGSTIVLCTLFIFIKNYQPESIVIKTYSNVNILTVGKTIGTTPDVLQFLLPLFQCILLLVTLATFIDSAFQILGHLRVWNAAIAVFVIIDIVFLLFAYHNGEAIRLFNTHFALIQTFSPLISL